ncbi:MAG TPA: hypothetical protein DCX54_03975 [Flavobacteriales bacterium]|nr:hypothetical protein [Flavobacteriales bacterium]
MKLNLKGLFCLFLGLFMSLNGLVAQTKYESEADMIKAADDLYENGQYVNAMPLFSQLVSLYPKEASYNMKYGVCLLHAERDKAECLKYLKYAAGKSEADPISNYYYGEALHRNYELNKAIKYYSKFKSLGNAKKVASLDVDRKIEMCNNGKALLSNVLDLNVLEKKEINREEFFRIYELGEIGGKIIVKPDEFKSKLDLKLGETSLIYLPEEARELYMSGYGDDKSKGLEIFRLRKSASGDWGSPENIGSPVNTDYDEDYPFMHPDGSLYFASKGHNSMGGYDLFKSSYNESTGTWSQPENLNFAISSTFDDILFISDFKNQLAYFASDRSSIDGKIVVYRVQISRKPFDLAFIKGKFISESESEIKSAKITIYDLEENSKVGTYFTDKESGAYDIQFPKSGRSYKFVVETDENSPVHTGKVDIPEQQDLASLKQEIRLVGSGENQKLVIKNLFDPSSKTGVDEESMLALLKSASNLEVNSSFDDVMKEISGQPDIKASELNKPGELESISEQHKALKVEMTELANQLSLDLNELEIAIEFGYKYSFDKSKKADEMYDKVEELRLKMENENDPETKESTLNQLLKKRSELEPIASDAIVSFDFTESLLNEFEEKKNDQDRIKKSLSEIKSKGDNLSDEEMQNDLKDFGPKIQDLKGMKSVYEMAPERYKELIDGNNEKLGKQESYYNDISSDLNSLKDEIKRLNEKIDATTNKKAKSQLSAEKGAKEIDLEDLTYEYKEVKDKYQKLKIEKRSLESDARQLSGFITTVKSQRQLVGRLDEDESAELAKLIEYFKEQRYIEDVIGKEYQEFIASGSSDQDLNKAQYYAAVDNS